MEKIGLLNLIAQPLPHLGKLPDLQSPPKVDNLNRALDKIETWAQSLTEHLTQQEQAISRVVEAIDDILSASAANGKLVKKPPRKRRKP